MFGAQAIFWRAFNCQSVLSCCQAFANGLKLTRPYDQVRPHLRAACEQDPVELITTFHIIAVYFQTVAAANNWWR
ncbi:hexameric tyrosine-coordinated heme protein [Bradyrhizobium guangdongense]